MSGAHQPTSNKEGARYLQATTFFANPAHFSTLAHSFPFTVTPAHPSPSPSSPGSTISSSSSAPSPDPSPFHTLSTLTSSPSMPILNSLSAPTLRAPSRTRTRPTASLFIRSTTPRTAASAGSTTLTCGGGTSGSPRPATVAGASTRTGISCVTSVDDAGAVLTVMHRMGTLSAARLVRRMVAVGEAAQERRARRRTGSGTSRLMVFEEAEAMR